MVLTIENFMNLSLIFSKTIKPEKAALLPMNSLVGGIGTSKS